MLSRESVRSILPVSHAPTYHFENVQVTIRRNPDRSRVFKVDMIVNAIQMQLRQGDGDCFAAFLKDLLACYDRFVASSGCAAYVAPCLLVPEHRNRLLRLPGKAYHNPRIFQERVERRGELSLCPVWIRTILMMTGVVVAVAKTLVHWRVVFGTGTIWNGFVH